MRWQAAAMAVLGAAAAAPAWAVAGGDAAAHDARMRVQIVAVQQTTLSAEIAAKIAALPLREGDAFRAGQLLVGFDCDLYRASLARAEAEADAARKTVDVDQRLSQLHSIGQLDVAQAEAKLHETAAGVAAMQATVRRCSIVAPFAGRVVKRRAEPYQYVEQGSPLLDIVDTRQLEVRLIVPSRWLVWLRRDEPFAVHVDDLERDYHARVVRIGARVDPVNQSVDVVGRINGAPAELLPGMSGWAQFAAHP